jgi:regulator of cell morphogenesis and NO signaling
VNSFTLNQSLAEVVSALPDSTRVLESFGLDYCCGGHRSLGDACSDAGIGSGVVLDALADIEPGPAPDWASMGPVELVDHIENTHHAYLHSELGRLDALAEKVAGVHGARHREVIEVEAVYGELHADLEPHLMKEERVLFPMIRALVTSSNASSSHNGSVRNPISVMMLEHDRAGELLELLSAMTDRYQAPEDGCASYRALYDGLARLESDTHLHIYKENNLLFPTVIALEEEGIAPQR